MSLDIDTKRVKQILLPDGQWHEIEKGSFTTDAYDYQQVGLIPTTGATWREADADGTERVVFCPMTAIQALSYGWSGSRKRN